ncbi:A24 family peptidase [Pyruvatibacter sp.]|uniref:A24 family peptidase n=1 Tax=Pyruvatibacter sp. TaxID=1981328 RepID=UPI003266FF0A
MIASLPLYALFLTVVLIAAIDLKTYRIPDVPTLCVAGLGLVSASLERDASSNFALAALGCLAFGGTLYAVRATYLHLRQTEMLGLGDVKLAAAAGIWLGPLQLPSFLLLSSMATLLVAMGMSYATKGRLWPGQGKRIPFGPGLAFALFLLALSEPLVDPIG